MIKKRVAFYGNRESQASYYMTIEHSRSHSNTFSKPVLGWVFEYFEHLPTPRTQLEKKAKILQIHAETELSPTDFKLFLYGNEAGPAVRYYNLVGYGFISSHKKKRRNLFITASTRGNGIVPANELKVDERVMLLLLWSVVRDMSRICRLRGLTSKAQPEACRWGQGSAARCCRACARRSHPTPVTRRSTKRERPTCPDHLWLTKSQWSSLTRVCDKPVTANCSDSFCGKLELVNMYKTVRHGENSLQYTILPQTEEVLNNSGMKGKGRDYSPTNHVRRSSRRLGFKNYCLAICILLLLVTAAVTLVSVLGQKLFDPWFQSDRQDIMSSVIKYRVQTPEETTPASELETTSTPSTTSYATTTVTITTVTTTVERTLPTTPPWIMPALRSWKSSSTIQTIPTEGSDLPPEKPRRKELKATDNMSIKPWEKDTIIRPTATPESITLSNVIKYYTRASKPSEMPVVASTKEFDDVLITTKNTPVTETTENSKMSDLKDALLSVDDDDDFKESLEVDEVFSLPPLKPEGPYSDGDEVTMSKPVVPWYGSRWPFVDTSSYFQWSVSIVLFYATYIICNLYLLTKRNAPSR